MVKPTSRTCVRATAHGHEVAERAQTSNDASRIPPISPATAAIATARRAQPHLAGAHDECEHDQAAEVLAGGQVEEPAGQQRPDLPLAQPRQAVGDLVEPRLPPDGGPHGAGDEAHHQGHEHHRGGERHAPQCVGQCAGEPRGPHLERDVRDRPRLRVRRCGRRRAGRRRGLSQRGAAAGVVPCCSPSLGPESLPPRSPDVPLSTIRSVIAVPSPIAGDQLLAQHRYRYPSSRLEVQSGVLLRVCGTRVPGRDNRGRAPCRRSAADAAPLGVRGRPS